MLLEWMKQEKLRKYKRELLTLLKVEGKVEVVIMKIDLWAERLQGSVPESFLKLFLAAFSQEIRNLITQEFLNRRTVLGIISFIVMIATRELLAYPFNVGAKIVKDLTGN
jgi:hypothetical protein